MMVLIETRKRRREQGLLNDAPRCSKCDQPNDRAPQRYCTACNRTYQREWRRGRVLVPKGSVSVDQAKHLRPRRRFT